MHAATMFFALSAALPAVLAYDPEFLTWCHESEVNVNGVSCLGWQMPDKCADCLMPIEHQCSGEWDSDEFLDCFCPIPTGQWPKIQSCFNNAANECQNDPTEVFNGYSTMCFKWRERQAEYVCEPKNQQGNLAVTKLARFVCDDSSTTKPATSSGPKPTSSVPKPTSSVPKPTSSVPKPTTCSSALTSKPSPTGPGNNGTMPCGGSGCGTPPIVVAGASAAQLSAAVVLAAAVAALL